MRPKPSSREAGRLSWGALGALLAIVVIGAAVWRLIRTPGLRGWPAVWGFGGLGIVVAVVILQDIHESRRIRQAVAEALRGRPRLTDEEFGSQFHDPAIAPVASRLRRLLAEHLNCDLAGMTPTDDFENWLALSSGPDSAGDSFYEELAIEYQLRRDCPWPKRFDSFEVLVKFVSENTPATEGRPHC